MWTRTKHNYDKHVEQMENWKDIAKEEDWASKVQYFNNRNVITLVRVEKGQMVDWAQIIFNSLCSELDRWSRRIRGIRKILVNLPWYWQKSFSICLCIKRKNPQKPPAKVKQTKEEM